MFLFKNRNLYNVRNMKKKIRRIIPFPKNKNFSEGT